MKRATRATLAGFALLSTAMVMPPAYGQSPEDARLPTPVLKDRPDQASDSPDALLDEPFESRPYGISLRPPRGSKIVRTVIPEEIAQFVHDDRGWTLKAGRSILEKGIALSTTVPSPAMTWKDP